MHRKYEKYYWPYIGRVNKQRLYIRDLLFIERFTFTGDHAIPCVKFEQTWQHFEDLKQNL